MKTYTINVIDEHGVTDTYTGTFDTITNLLHYVYGVQYSDAIADIIFKNGTIKIS